MCEKKEEKQTRNEKELQIDQYKQYSSVQRIECHFRFNEREESKKNEEKQLNKRNQARLLLVRNGQFLT